VKGEKLKLEIWKPRFPNCSFVSDILDVPVALSALERAAIEGDSPVRATGHV